jgi:hypothetical protein
MSTVSRILGEAIRPPTEVEKRDPHWAYWYAKDVLDGRFPEGEAAIATDPYWAHWYALNVIKGRFPEGEAVIATDPKCSEQYLKIFPEAKLDWAMNGLIDWTDL